MKALIREKGETVLEYYNIPGIDWSTGYPLTSPKWFGGPYKLVQNYVPPQENTPESYEEVVVEPEQVETEPDPVVEENEDDYVVIDGKRYSKEELRKLIE